MKKNKVLFFALSVIFVFVFYQVFSLVPLVANDLTFLSQDELRIQFNLPFAWWNRGSAGLGDYSVPLLWFWPMDVLYGIGAQLNLNFPILERLLGFVPTIVLGVFSIRKLLTKYNIGNGGIFVGTLLYLLNTYFLLLVDGGQFALAISYSLLPYIFVVFIHSYEKQSFYSLLLASVTLGLLSVMDIRYVYLAGLLLFFYIMYELVFLSKKEYFPFLKKWLVVGIFSGLLVCGLLAYMIIPAFFAESISLPSTYARVSQTSFLSFASVGNAILLLQPHWYKNVFGNLTTLRFQFIVFPLLAFSAPLFCRKNKAVGFWVFISIIGIFLTKGSLEPLSTVYPWLFTHVPGFSLFRDSTKFFVFVCLAYSVLSAFTVHVLSTKWTIVKNFAPVIFSLYILFITFPVWTGKMTGILSIPRNLEEFYMIKDILEADKEFGRVLWIPSRAPLAYANNNHPTLEASRVVVLRPFGIGTIGSYELFNFLRDAPFMEEILKVSGVRYVAYPYPDEKRQELKPDEKEYYFNFLDQLTHATWSEGRITEPPFALIKTKESSPHIFLSPNHYYVLGSDSIYTEFSSISGFDLSKNAVTFLEENNTMSLNQVLDPFIILYKKDIVDLSLNFIDLEEFIFPAKELPFEPITDSSWWKRESSDIISWRAFLQEKYGIDNLDFDYGGGIAIAEGSQSLQIPNNKLQMGKILFARVMESSKSGKVEFYQDDVKIGEVITKDESPQKEILTLHGSSDIADTQLEYDEARVNWHEVGTLQNDSPITIQTEGDINVINALVVIDQSDWDTVQNEIQELVDNRRVIQYEDLTQTAKDGLFQKQAKGNIEFKKVSPVHYEVTVSDITHPQMVVLSESYSPYWEMNGVKSTKVYSLLNGFTVSQNGEYDIYFSAQKYVSTGFIISGITLFSLAGVLFYIKKKYNR